MYKVATDEEINNLVHKIVSEYKREVLEELSEYQLNQKIPRNKVTEILNEIYDSKIEGYFFVVEESEG